MLTVVISSQIKNRSADTDRIPIDRRTMMSSIVCRSIPTYLSLESKLYGITCHCVPLCACVATYIVCFQLGSVFKDASCEEGFAEHVIERSLILVDTGTNTHTHTDTRHTQDRINTQSGRPHDKTASLYRTC